MVARGLMHPGLNYDFYLSVFHETLQYRPLLTKLGVIKKNVETDMYAKPLPNPRSFDVQNSKTINRINRLK